MILFVDSDVMIEVLRGRDKIIQSRWLSLAEEEATILYSPVSTAEIWGGARSSEHEQIIRLFRPLQCAPIDHTIGEIAGEFMRRYARSHSLELPDALIAASAHATQSTLWTRNRKHYPMTELRFY